MARRASLLAFAFLGCAAPNGPPKTTVLPALDGEPRFEMNCGDLPACRAEAEFRCGGPFEIEQILGRGYYSLWGRSPYLGQSPNRVRVRCTGAPSGD